MTLEQTLQLAGKSLRDFAVNAGSPEWYCKSVAFTWLEQRGVVLTPELEQEKAAVQQAGTSAWLTALYA